MTGPRGRFGGIGPLGLFSADWRSRLLVIAFCFVGTAIVLGLLFGSTDTGTPDGISTETPTSGAPVPLDQRKAECLRRYPDLPISEEARRTFFTTDRAKAQCLDLFPARTLTPSP